MATEGKRFRPSKGFYKTVEDGVRIKQERVIHKPVAKVDKKEMYPIEVIFVIFCHNEHINRFLIKSENIIWWKYILITTTLTFYRLLPGIKATIV